MAEKNAHSSADGTRFVAYLTEKLPLVEQALAETVARPLTDLPQERDLTRYLYEPLERFTASGGKRVRPVLALLGAEAVGGETARALSPAVAIELFQSAALIHDDIADEGELRRGEPCLHISEGTGIAINAGDLALTRVFEIVLTDEGLEPARRLRVLDELARMERHTLEGQALDLGWVRDARWDISSADYFYMVDSKTAWYTAASPLLIGAIAGGADDARARRLIEVGTPAGIVFQVQDDLLNLVGDADAQGKDFRSDITEGKRTLAVVTALENLEGAPREELVGLLRAKTSDPADLARAVDLIEAGGGIATCRDVAHKNAERAIAAAHSLADEGVITHPAAEVLESMVHFFMERNK